MPQGWRRLSPFPISIYTSGRRWFSPCPEGTLENSSRIYPWGGRRKHRLIFYLHTDCLPNLKRLGYFQSSLWGQGMSNLPILPIFFFPKGIETQSIDLKASNKRTVPTSLPGGRKPPILPGFLIAKQNQKTLCVPSATSAVRYLPPTRSQARMERAPSRGVWRSVKTFC